MWRLCYLIKLETLMPVIVRANGLIIAVISELFCGLNRSFSVYGKEVLNG